jgi:hypothetical protein
MATSAAQLNRRSGKRTTRFNNIPVEGGKMISAEELIRSVTVGHRHFKNSSRRERRQRLVATKIT